LTGPLPSDIEELLAYSAGFEIAFGHQLNLRRMGETVPVLFTGSRAVELNILPHTIDLLGDGCGNFWVVDVNQNGMWGAVIFVCHDPPVIAIQAQNLAEFVSQILDPEHGERREALKYVHEQAVSRIWREEPWLVPVVGARVSRDETVRSFSNQIPETCWIADLRSREIGSGFSWGKAGPESNTWRNGSDLIFGVEGKAPGILNRLFSRR
jgi:hypothetical protein